MQGDDGCDANLDRGLRGVVPGSGTAVGAAEAAAWAQRLGVPVLEAQPEPPGVILVANRPPALRILGRKVPRPLQVDFAEPRLQQRLAGTTVRRDPLARAVGLHRRPAGGIVDATAGLGRDAWILAGLGARVHAIEASPTLAALLQQALERALDDDRLAMTARRLQLHPGDLRQVLAWLPPPEREVIYLDPMYPEGTTRGAVGREAQTLRALHGSGRPADEATLLAAARAHATGRVVVKRPQRARPVDGSAPQRSVSGRAIRFDLYAPEHG
ncbi:MAG: class I SAM-dependent methyltransferase [Halorhodospira sp.]